MKIEEIDWNRVCSAMKREKAFNGANSDYWNKRAPSFARNRSGSDYADRFLRLLKSCRRKINWAVLWWDKV